MGYEYDEIEQIHRETVQERDDGVRKIVRGFDPKYLVIIGIIILVAMYMVNEGLIKKDQLYTYLGILIVIILLLAYSKMAGASYLTLEEAKAAAWVFCRKEQKLQRMPPGEMNVMPDSHLQWSGDTPWKYTIGIDIQPREDNPREYEVLIDPKRGGMGVIGLKWCRYGYKPQERRDVDWMKPATWVEEKAHNEYVNDGRSIRK